MSFEIMRRSPARNLEEDLELGTFAMRLDSFENLQNVIVKVFEEGRRGSVFPLLISFRYREEEVVDLCRAETVQLSKEVLLLRERLESALVPVLWFSGADENPYFEIIEADKALIPKPVWISEAMSATIDWDGLIWLEDLKTQESVIGSSFQRVNGGYQSSSQVILETSESCLEKIEAELLSGLAAIGDSIERLHETCQAAVESEEEMRILWG